MRYLCRRCEVSTDVVMYPPIGLCHRCLFGMPDEEHEWLMKELEEKGIIPVGNGPDSE